MDYNHLQSRIGNTRGHFSKKENRAAKLVAQWEELRSKFDCMIHRGNGTTETARCAFATLLMMETGIRIGNEDSAEGFICNQKHHPLFGQPVQTFGLTTLLNSHVCRAADKLEISFTGKKLVSQNLTVTNPVLVKFCPTGNPDDLFLGIDYNALKCFIKRYVGNQFSPKDLRTAKVNLTFCEVYGNEPFTVEVPQARKLSDKKRLLATAIEMTATRIGHTKSVCRSSYMSKPLLEYIVQSFQPQPAAVAA